MAEKTVGVALLGCGIVGGGVVAILKEQQELIRQRTGIRLELRHVVVKSEAEYPPNASELPMSLNANAVIDDPRSEVIIELIGGTGVAGAFFLGGLELGNAGGAAEKF